MCEDGDDDDDWDDGDEMTRRTAPGRSTPLCASGTKAVYLKNANSTSMINALLPEGSETRSERCVGARSSRVEDDGEVVCGEGVYDKILNVAAPSRSVFL